MNLSLKFNVVFSTSETLHIGKHKGITCHFACKDHVVTLVKDFGKTSVSYRAIAISPWVEHHPLVYFYLITASH